MKRDGAGWGSLTGSRLEAAETHRYKPLFTQQLYEYRHKKRGVEQPACSMPGSHYSCTLRPVLLELEGIHDYT